MNLADTSSLLAQLAASLLDEVGVGLAILLTLLGVVLHFYQPRHQMSVEERVKDNKMTEDEARRQIRFYKICAPSVSVLGVVFLAFAFYEIGTSA
jgi:hypothetical protein